MRAGLERIAAISVTVFESAVGISLPGLACSGGLAACSAASSSDGTLAFVDCSFTFEVSAGEACRHNCRMSFKYMNLGILFCNG